VDRLIQSYILINYLIWKLASPGALIEDWRKPGIGMNEVK